ncbi:MAG: hypothetical protein N2645_18370 [Clostridia bacterium]|nr:hypothetical protein [Clostridia bacterium]
MYLPMIDTLIFSVDIKDYVERNSKLFDSLYQKKTQAKNAESENRTEIVYIKLGNMTFEVLGNGKKGFAYILHNDFYELNLAQFRSENKEFFPVFVRIKAECLWSQSPEKAYEKIYEWMEENLGEIINEKISRIDLCCHTDELELEISDMERFRGTFHNLVPHFYRRKLNAMCFGSRKSSSIYCRIYNKSLEVRQTRNKDWFYDIWKAKDMKTKNVWNVEFELHRDHLKDYNINTVKQAFDSLRSMWELLTKKWLVLINLDASRKSRCSTNYIWFKIQESFKDYRSQELVKRNKQLQREAEAIIPSMFGNITTFCAKINVSDENMAFNLLKIYGRKYFESKADDFGCTVLKKKSLINRNENILSKKEFINEEDLKVFEMEGDL